MLTKRYIFYTIRIGRFAFGMAIGVALSGRAVAS